MVDQWTGWKKFPQPQRGEHLDAPFGPGVYELRRASSGELVGFGHSSHVAATLARQMRPTLWKRWTGAIRDAGDIEYRTMAASSPRTARDHATKIERRRAAYWGRLALRA